ncbi:MAG: ABC transporter substrate-binding protein [Anditalea sp.]
MDKIRIVGVPEHFNYPWLKIIEEQPFRKEGILLEWNDEPKGSGAMNKAVTEGSADVAVILTESFIRDKIEGNPGKIIGFQVFSPLIWGIHISSKFQIEEMDELKNSPFLISRYGSGSHLMAYLLAGKNGWDLDQLEFEIVGDIDGAKRALKSTLPKVFLWEKYTTMPLVDEGIFKRVGEIPTPWPCFVMVASKEALIKHPQYLKTLQGLIYQKSSFLLEAEDLPLQLSKKYGIKVADVKEWLHQTEWATKGEIHISTLKETMETLKTLKLIPGTIPVEELVDQEFVTLK